MARRKPTVILTGIYREFQKAFERLEYRHSCADVWRDFIVIFACQISLTTECEQNEQRREMMEAARKRYTADELATIEAMIDITKKEMMLHPDQDFLGQMYMDLCLGKTGCAQYFTPYHISRLMAEMTVGMKEKEGESSDTFLPVVDNACGSGVMLIAYANAYRKRINDPDKKILYVGQDIDSTVALMCFIQLSLLDCPGYVGIGDALKKRPEEIEDDNLWLTPCCYNEGYIEFIQGARKYAKGA